MNKIKQNIKEMYEKTPSLVDITDKDLLRIYWKQYDNIDVGHLWAINATAPDTVSRIARLVRRELGIKPKTTKKRKAEKTNVIREFISRITL